MLLPFKAHVALLLRQIHRDVTKRWTHDWGPCGKSHYHPAREFRDTWHWVEPDFFPNPSEPFFSIGSIILWNSISRSRDSVDERILLISSRRDISWPEVVQRMFSAVSIWTQTENKINKDNLNREHLSGEYLTSPECSVGICMKVSLSCPGSLQRRGIPSAAINLQSSFLLTTRLVHADSAISPWLRTISGARSQGIHDRARSRAPSYLDISNTQCSTSREWISEPRWTRTFDLCGTVRSIRNSSRFMPP